MKPPMDDAYVLLPFAAFRVDPRACPLRRHDFDHWRLSPVPVGRGNAVCGCVELSPNGDMRERSVPCSTCRRPTFNHSAKCDAHREAAS